MKTVLVTGASRGIGKATARLFAERGYSVLINYNHSKEAAEKLCRELLKKGFIANTFKADVSNRCEVDKMLEYFMSTFGSVDVLVNNAGISQISTFGEISETEWDKVMGVNLKGVFNCCQAVLPSMINNKRGKIINVSSIWGITGASCEVLYSVSKAGVIGLTKALAKELGPSNIQVNCVAPGIIDTEMNAGLNRLELDNLKEETPLLRLGMPLEVAKSIFFLSSEESDFITGQVLSPNGGFVI